MVNGLLTQVASAIMPTLISCASIVPYIEAQPNSKCDRLIAMGRGDRSQHRKPISALPGAATFDSAMSFGLIRGGHVDVTVLGGLQVDAEGHLANWMIPGKMVPGMGGAMDLVSGAKRVIVAMQHAAKGKSKIVAKCNLPLTSTQPVDLVVTEMGVIAFPGGNATLQETAPGVTVAEVLAVTEADLSVPDKVPEMKL